MRAKTRAGRAKPRKRPSLKLSSPSTTPFPSPTQVEAGEDVTVPDTYSDSDNGMQCGDAIPGTSAKVILQSCNRDSEGAHEESMDVNWLEKRSCLKCCRTGEMLECAETGCPIAIHEKCLSCKPIIDNTGNFYCPYCSYKRAVAEYQEKRRKFMLHRRSFPNFLKPKAAAEDKGQEEDGIAAVKETASSLGSKKQGAHNSNARDAVLQHHSKRLDQSQVKRKLGIDEAVQEEDSRELDNDPPNPVVDEQQAKASDAGHEEDGIAGVKETVSSIASKKLGANDSIARNAVLQHQSERLDQSQVKRKLRIDEAVQEENSREVNDDLSDSVVAERQVEASDAGHKKDGIAAVKETASSIGSKKQGANDSIAMNAVLQNQLKRPDQSQVKRKLRIDKTVQEENSREDDDLSDLVVDEHQAEASNAGCEEDGGTMDYTDEISEDREEMEHVLPKKSSPKPVASAGKGVKRVKSLAVKKSKKLHKSSKKVVKVKRRRLIWTAEEEEMLKEGVKKFERKSRNLPWRKILELGHKVFDQTRTPSDLKDKWKNMVARNLWRS